MFRNIGLGCQLDIPELSDIEQYGQFDSILHCLAVVYPQQ